MLYTGTQNARRGDLHILAVELLSLKIFSRINMKYIEKLYFF